MIDLLGASRDRARLRELAGVDLFNEAVRRMLAAEARHDCIGGLRVLGDPAFSRACREMDRREQLPQQLLPEGAQK
jgi:hypothetical protein